MKPGDHLLATFGDLLTAELSSLEGTVEIVERSELQRIADEKSLPSLDDAAGTLVAARLAHAHGLVFTTRDSSDPQQPRLLVRLTDCANGLILSSLALDGHENDLPVAAKQAAGLLRFPAQRLIGNHAAKPLVVSLLGVRQGMNANDPFAVTLNTALAHQLSCQPGLVVAERWRLDDAVFERSLTVKEIPMLTTGSALLDGSYETKEGGLAVTLRIRENSTAPPRLVRLEGLQGEPTAIALRMAEALTRELSGKAMVAWDAKQEATRYSELGQWLVARRMGVEAAQALETAVALGDSSPATRVERLRAYAMIVCPSEDKMNVLSPQRTDVDGLDRLAPDDFEQAFEAMTRLASHMRDLVDARWPGFDRDALYPAENRRFSHRAVCSLGEEVLHAQFLRKDHLRLASGGRLLRALTRELLAKGAAEHGPTFGDSDIHVQFACETPEEAVAAYRKMLDPKKLSSDENSTGRQLRNDLWATADHALVPRAIDWSRLENQQGELAWKRFLDELSRSPLLLQRADALALAYQAQPGEPSRAKLLQQFIELLEANPEELATPVGQLVLFAFGAKGAVSTDPLREHYLERFMRALTPVIARADWLESSSLNTVRTVALCSDPTPSGKQPSIDCARALLEAVERFAERAPMHARWRKQTAQEFGEEIDAIREHFFNAYPAIAASRIKPASSAPDAVPLRAWSPPVPEARRSRQPMGDWICTSRIVWNGQRLFIPLKEPYLVTLNSVTLAASTTEFPGVGNSSASSMDAIGDTLMVYTGSELHEGTVRHPSSIWKQVALPKIDSDPPLGWKVIAHDGAFHIGSVLPPHAPNPRHLLGKFTESKLNWPISSSRVPAQHPFESKRPRSILGIFAGYQGRPILFTELFQDGPRTQQIFELDGAVYLGNLGSGGALQKSGDRVLHWHGYRDDLFHVIAFDREREKPQLILRNPRPRNGISPLDDGWEKVTPLLDEKQPEFAGDFIAPVEYAGKLWLLKWEKREHRTASHDPNDLRLVCVDLTKRQAIVIPLLYDVPDDVRRLKSDTGLDMTQPEFNGESLIATPAGLFIGATDGTDSQMWSHAFSPVLLHLRWSEVNAWIRKNHPEF